MSKISSYLDWELRFRETTKKVDLDYSKKQINSLGIPKAAFKEFMENWKTKNL
jgi:hypothetical protein